MNAKAEEGRALITQAAIEVTAENGVDTGIRALPAPLPKENRKYLYSVDSSERYGSDKLYDVLASTRTPHLVEIDPSSSRHGLKYVEAGIEHSKMLDPFFEKEARQAWVAQSRSIREQTEFLQKSAMVAKDAESISHLDSLFPEPQNNTEAPVFDKEQAGSISQVNKTRRNARNETDR